jgi:hypothetical protein
MNTDAFDRLTPLDDDFLDRIVDGGLGPDQLRQAIAVLDSHPDGWKRCGAAFLEAQCWRESLRGAEAGERRPMPLVAVPSRPASSHWLRRASALIGLAASFALGWLGHEWRPPTAPAAVPADSSSSVDLVQQQASPSPVARASWDGSGVVGRPAIHEIGRLRIVAGDHGEAAEVPVLDGPGLDPDWLTNQPPPLSEHERVALERQGFEVDQERRLISTTLPDGRRVAVPMDRVQIRYSGNHAL